MLRRPATWEESKKQLGDANFMMKLKEFDKDKLDDGLLKKIAKITVNPDFQPEIVGKVGDHDWASLVLLGLVFPNYQCFKVLNWVTIHPEWGENGFFYHSQQY